MSFKEYSFTDEPFVNYRFDVREELSYGYDKQGHLWRGKEFTKLWQQGLIIKECLYQDVFLDNALIGYMQQEKDGTWLAHSLFYPKEMSDMGVSGFVNEFYAALYLHQIALSQYPESVEEIPCLPWERKK